MWTLGFVLIVQLLFRGSSYANEFPEQVFTENGSPVAYPLDEDVADQLIGERADAENWSKISGLEEVGDVDEGSLWNQDEPEVGKKTDIENEKEEKRGPIRKREGQAEYTSFIDPAPSRRSVREKQSFHEGGFEKRAKVDGSGRRVSEGDVGDTVFIAVATVCTAAAVFGLVGAAFVWRRVHNRHKAACESEYPAYGVTGPAKERSGSTSPVAAMDAKLASSAQLYHYQHTKQQILAMEQSACESKGQDSEDSEGEEDEGDFSVYEYPGLAPTGDIEVSNPLFENAASPLTKTDPKVAELEPRIHQRHGERGEDP